MNLILFKALKQKCISIKKELKVSRTKQDINYIYDLILNLYLAEIIKIWFCSFNYGPAIRNVYFPSVHTNCLGYSIQILEERIGLDLQHN